MVKIQVLLSVYFKGTLVQMIQWSLVLACGIHKTSPLKKHIYKITVNVHAKGLSERF